jgi:Sec-independent protein translocase protein TatA
MVEIRVFPKKIPENAQDLRKSLKSGKSVFSGFQDDAKIQPISENPRKKFPENRTFFGGKFPKIPEN